MEEQSDVKSVPVRVLSITMIAAIIIMVWIQFAFPLVIVSGSSMRPTYTNGELLISTRSFKVSNLNRNDVIVFSRDGKKKLIKRIIGLPGETIEVTTSGIFINGQRYEGEFPDPAIPAGKEETYTLSDNEFYVLGDNRSVSIDSRSYGPIQFDSITAKVTAPFTAFNKVKAWFSKGE